MAKHLRDLTPEEVIIAEDALMNFQFAVIDAMREQNISQTQLAEKLGISRARVSQMLSSEANPTLKVVGRALAALDIEAVYTQKSKVTITSTANSRHTWDTRVWEPGSEPAKPVWHNDNKVRGFTASNRIREAA